FLVSALFFALATATRSMMATYLGVAAFLVAFIVVNVVLQDPEKLPLAALVEPFGLAALSLATRYFTAAESNTLTPAIEGALLYNRLIWTGVGLAALGPAYLVFNFEVRGSKRRKIETSDEPPTLAPG